MAYVLAIQRGMASSRGQASARTLYLNFKPAFSELWKVHVAERSKNIANDEVNTVKFLYFSLFENKCRDAPCLLSLLLLFVHFLTLQCHHYFSMQFLCCFLHI